MPTRTCGRCLLPSPESILGLLAGVAIGWHPSDPSYVAGVACAWSGAAVGWAIAGIRLACLGRSHAPWRQVLTTALIWPPCGLAIGWAMAVCVTSMKWYWVVFALLGLVAAAGIAIGALTRNFLLLIASRRARERRARRAST